MATTIVAGTQPQPPEPRSHAHAPLPESAPGSSHFEAHIQGLRAVAVALVVLNHLVGWPVGGFIGVDVFFVISGYLITRLMLREVAATGRISIREFYARRMRRIFPMATVVLVVTVAVGFILFSGGRAMSTLTDALWASIFLENWHLARVGSDYFHLNDAVSPVQQYWSLSVEEQFYLIWPAMLLALAFVSRRFGLPRRLSLRSMVAAVLALVLVASFVWAVVQSATSPTVAYFSTATRAWELAAGALLAVAALQLSDKWARQRGLVASASLVIILLAAVTITSEMPFPGPWAMVPVLATVTILAIGHGATGPGMWVLRSAPFQYVGAISYSLYLWHFPVIIFLFTVVEQTLLTTVFALLLALVAVGCVLSIHRTTHPALIVVVSLDWRLDTRTAQTTSPRSAARGRECLDAAARFSDGIPAALRRPE